MHVVSVQAKVSGDGVVQGMHAMGMAAGAGALEVGGERSAWWFTAGSGGGLKTEFKGDT